MKINAIFSAFRNRYEYILNVIILKSNSIAPNNRRRKYLYINATVGISANNHAHIPNGGNDAENNRWIDGNASEDGTTTQVNAVVKITVTL